MKTSILTPNIVLVGLCNDEPMIQHLLGNFKIDFKTKRPVLIEFNNSKCYHEVMFRYNTFTFPTWCGGHGLSIRQDADSTWKFTTGLNPHDTGSSGILINGGPEMQKLYTSWESNK